MVQKPLQNSLNWRILTGKIFDEIEQLSDIGLIEVSLTKPTTYNAVPIEAALNAVKLKQQAETR